MFSFFRRKSAPAAAPTTPAPDANPVGEGPSGGDTAQIPAARAEVVPPEVHPTPVPPQAEGQTPTLPIVHESTPAPAPSSAPRVSQVPTPQSTSPASVEVAAASEPRQSWLGRLRQGLSKTGASISAVFVNAKIDDELYDELESALLCADVGVKATSKLLDDLRRRVKAERAQDAAAVKALLQQGLAQMLKPLEKSLTIGQHPTTVMMVAGVNGAGKTTSIGKLTRHLSGHGASVLLAAADTFRAAAKEQLAIWADRNLVEIISQAEADPAAVSFDAVKAGIARARDVVIIDTAGRLPTQLHLMEELRKIKRVVQKAESTAPHEVLLVLDGNTGQNALAQVKAFDDALTLTGLIVTKLDGTAKGGVLAAIAMERPVPVYFIGVGEQLQDLQTFDAQEFAQALLP